MVLQLDIKLDIAMSRRISRLSEYSNNVVTQLQLDIKLELQDNRLVQLQLVI